MKTPQEFIHWLEVGRGSTFLKRAAVLAAILALSVLVAWKQFHGPVSEATLLQADVGRQLARGEGFTTLVTFPQTAAILQQRGVEFDPARPYPELHHAPLYSVTIAAALRLLPTAKRDALFTTAPVPPDGFHADYLLLALNVAFLWLAAWLTFDLGRRLFDERVGWVAMLGVLLSVALWQATVAVNGTTLLMVLALLALRLWLAVDVAAERSPSRPALWALLGLGAGCGALFLTEYSAGALVLVALGYAARRFTGSGRLAGAALITAGFLAVTAPWILRNVALSGHPIALAAQNLALRAGDPTAEPSFVRATLAAELPSVDLRKLANKTLTAVQDTLARRVWSGGALWLSAFFVAGWLYAFRSPTANRLRWVASVAFAVLLIAQSACNTGETERLVAVWYAPVLMIFGAAFFYVLLDSNTAWTAWPRAAAAGLLLLQAAPLVRDVAEPRRLHFQYPPYFPGLFQGMRAELVRRGAVGRFGVMADVPAGVAWYGQMRAWAQPPRLRDFYAITLHQPIGELLLTPRTLDRPFFSELNARPILPGMLAAVPTRFGEWGEVYGGLLTGNLPRDFPLRSPEKLAENLFVLLNPALPPVPGK